jgi:hypothetical protein
VANRQIGRLERSSEACFLTRITHKVTSRCRCQRHPCRKMSTGQRAMVTALALQAYGGRHSDGRVLDYQIASAASNTGVALAMDYQRRLSEDGMGRCIESPRKCVRVTRGLSM